MTNHSIAIHGYSIVFSTPGAAPGHSRYLRLIPERYLKHPGIREQFQNTLEMRIEIEGPGFSLQEWDFFAVGNFVELHSTLVAAHDCQSTSTIMRGDESKFFLQATWREVEHDLHFIALNPHPSAYDWRISYDPYFLRKSMRIATEIEFYLQPEALVNPISSLTNLLAHIKSL